jgi:hypothetical protein
VFGELLEVYHPSTEIAKYSVQQSGYYYQAAGTFAVERKKSVNRLLLEVCLLFLFGYVCCL